MESISTCCLLAVKSGMLSMIEEAINEVFSGKYNEYFNKRVKA